MPIYLDYAAASPPNDELLNEFSKLQKQLFYNPSALYTGANKSKLALDAAKAKLANSLQIKPHEIIYTSGATESNNIAIQGFCASHPNVKALTLEQEHSAITGPVLTTGGYLLKANKNNDTNLPLQMEDIPEDVGLISLSLVSSGTGVVLDIHKLKQLLADVIKKRQASGSQLPIFLHLDCSQAVQIMNVSPHSLGADMTTYNGSKIGAPSGTGSLFVKSSLSLSPVYAGGGQQRGLRQGTEQTAAWVVFSDAFVDASRQTVDFSTHLGQIQIYLEAGLEKLGAEIVAKNSKRSPSITRALFPDSDNEILAYKLNQKGIYVGLGSACHALKEPAGKDLLALGYAKSQSLGSLRFSFGKQTTIAEIDELLSALAKLI